MYSRILCFIENENHIYFNKSTRLFYVNIKLTVILIGSAEMIDV